MAEWIPTSERLPEIDKSVLCCDGKHMFVAKRVPLAVVDIWDANGERYSLDSAIAWMELPAPYKGE